MVISRHGVGMWIASVLLFLTSQSFGFTTKSSIIIPKIQRVTVGRAPTILRMAQVSEAEAKKGIDKVVNALRKDSTANQELGRLEKVTVVLGYGSPTGGSLNLRFNAQFKKGGKGMSSIPLPFGLGQSNESEGRGTMVGQVKATVDNKTGKVTSCSVFRDLGYGRAFNLKT